MLVNVPQVISMTEYPNVRNVVTNAPVVKTMQQSVFSVILEEPQHPLALVIEELSIIKLQIVNLVLFNAGNVKPQLIIVKNVVETELMNPPVAVKKVFSK